MIPGSGTRVNVDLLNAFQSKGLEEGNPRLPRPAARGLPGSTLLPRRLQVSVDYDFGGSAPAAAVKLPHLIGLVAAAAVGAAAALPAQEVSSDDSSFVLSSDDPARAPSPLIGNGRIGLVIPRWARSRRVLCRGAVQGGAGRRAADRRIPVWLPLGICPGRGCLDSTAAAHGQIEGYRQSLDLRSGAARTEYEWVSGGERATVRVESFVSRADGRTGATRLELTPAQAGRYRVRFALAGRAPPRRLALGRIERADPAWRPPTSGIRDT